MASALPINDKLYDAPPSYDSIYGVAVKLGHVDIWPKCTNGESKAKHALFDDFNSLIKRANEWLHMRPQYQEHIIVLQALILLVLFLDYGSIVSIDTVQLLVPYKEFQRSIDTSETKWNDKYKCHAMYFLRIFYVIGEPCQEYIGVADFLPEQVGDTGMFDSIPRFGNVDGLMAKVSKWVSQNQDVRVVNLQTIDTKYWKKSECGGRRLDTLNSFEPFVQERYRVFYLRVCYVKNPNITVQRPLQRLQHVLFRPRCEEGSGYSKKFEDMEMLQRRMRSWLDGQQTCSVVSVETIQVPSPLFRRNDIESSAQCAFSGRWFLGNDEGSTPTRYPHLPLIRIYLNGYVSNPPSACDAESGCVVM